MERCPQAQMSGLESSWKSVGRRAADHFGGSGVSSIRGVNSIVFLASLGMGW